MNFKQLSYQPDVLLRCFSSLSDRAWAMLLHSGFAEHPHSRFDILVADPRVTLTTRGQETEIISRIEMGLVEYSNADPFLLVQQQLDKLNLNITTHANLPFLGGALGLFGYDLGRRIERLSVIAKQDIELPDMAIGLYDWALIADHKEKQLTLVCHGNIEQRQNWLEQQKTTFHQPFQLTSPWKTNISRQQYGVKFHQIKEYLRSGDCYQVNLAQRFSTYYEGNEWQAFLHLSKINKAPFSAFIRLPQQTVISISPERFLYLRNKQIQTRPIKGTMPRLVAEKQDKQQAASLAVSLKDQAENLMIVDLLRNDIGRVAQPGSIQVPELFVVESFPAVHHLVSTITATLSSKYHATDLLRACFPGGSITGAPKVRAMQIIEQLEPHRRNIYCGNIGYISFCGTMDSNITIRTLLTECNKIHCSVGGAVIVDSEEQAEYQETLDKLGSILPPLSNVT